MRQQRRAPLSWHPFWEEAQLIRALLREDAEQDRLRTGRVVIAGNPDIEIPRLRAEAARLEHLARIDVEWSPSD